MNEKVFISYSHQDMACAYGIARYLKRHDCDVWIDLENLSLGDQWTGDIEKALQEADVVIGILSSSSLRRREVLKELDFALNRMKKEGPESFRVFFVVIGQIHPSWFRNEDDVKDIKEHLASYQFIELSAYGEVTIETTKKLLKAIRGQGIEAADERPMIKDNGFINQNSLPEKAFDNRSSRIFYKVFPADLAPSAVFPFALDKQWLPQAFYAEESSLAADFARRGFSSPDGQSFLQAFKERNLLLPLFHYKQLIIKLNTLIYEPYFRQILLSDGADRKALGALLGNGSIVVLLNEGQLTPFIYQQGRNEEDEAVIQAWNELGKQIPVYCIREDWSADADRHSPLFLRFCANLAIDHEANIRLAQALNIPKDQLNAFLITLKTISMQSFCQTHMNGTLAQDKVDDYSRSLFYRNYIVKNDSQDPLRPVYDCLFDEAKPFHKELKKLIDICYNSIFANTLQCKPLLPDDVRAQDHYLHFLYSTDGDKEVSIEELQYAFSEFFENCQILDEIEALGSALYLENYDLPTAVASRESEAWYEYVELLELMDKRSNSWKVDFNEIELLLQRFLRCFQASGKAREEDIAFSFRVLVGSKVLDIVKTASIDKVREYGPVMADQGRIPLRVFFSIGDLTRTDRHETVFLPVTLFSGRIDTSDGNGFFDRLKEFMIRQCGFIEAGN